MNVAEIFEGSSGEATRELYARLHSLGPIGIVAMNLFRAQKASARAKLYRRGNWKREAYQKKDWSISLLCDALDRHGPGLRISHGWGEDPREDHYPWVLYVDLPSSFGQVSYHALHRKCASDYPGEWDGVPNASAGRIVAWVSSLLNP